MPGKEKQGESTLLWQKTAKVLQSWINLNNCQQLQNRPLQPKLTGSMTRTDLMLKAMIGKVTIRQAMIVTDIIGMVSMRLATIVTA
jgi:hypothetical protein